MRNKIVYALVTNDLSYDQRMHRICSALVEDGYEVCLVGRELPDSAPLQPQVFHQKRLSCTFHSGILFYFEFNLRLIFFLLSLKCDIIHAVDLDTLGAGAVVKIFKRCRLVFDAHEYFTEVPELDGKKLKKVIWSNLGKLCVGRSDAAITVSKPLQKILSDKYGMDFHLVRNFPVRSDVEVSDSLIQERENILLYQGAVNKGRGVIEMITLMNEIEDYTLWVVGEGDLYDECRQLADEMGLKNRVKFYGYLAPEELKKVGLQAKIGLNLLTGESKNYQYSLANKFFDYIQVLVPSITMNFDTYRNILQEHRVGVAISEINQAEITASIYKIEADYEKYVSQCRIASRQYTWEKEKKGLLEIYRK